MTALRFRNITASVDDPVETWPFEGILAAVERGTLPDWRRLAAAVRAAPWGPVAQQVLEAVELSRPYGTADLLTAVIERARHDAADAEREQAASEIRDLVVRSGLSRQDFALRMGTSRPRLSTYMSGKVTPSASLMIRIRRVAAQAQAGEVRQLEAGDPVQNAMLRARIPSEPPSQGLRMKSVSNLLLGIGIVLLSTYVILVAWEWADEKFDSFYRKYIRKLGAENYMQSVLLPLYWSVVGGLFSTGVALLVDPPSHRNAASEFLSGLLVVAALVVGVLAALSTGLTYENRKTMLIELRIDQLKNGDWVRDSKADVLSTIQKDRAAVAKWSKFLNALFSTFLTFQIASDIDWVIFHYRVYALVAGAEALVLLAVVSAVAARYWIWPKALRSKLAELDSHQAEADKLSPPTPANASAAHRHRNHDLWIAGGGLIMGAILTRVGGTLRRGEQ